jgi:hypothetical protein
LTEEICNKFKYALSLPKESLFLSSADILR